jgi:hypothetical protein
VGERFSAEISIIFDCVQRSSRRQNGCARVPNRSHPKFTHQIFLSIIIIIFNLSGHPIPRPSPLLPNTDTQYNHY